MVPYKGRGTLTSPKLLPRFSFFLKVGDLTNLVKPFSDLNLFARDLNSGGECSLNY